MRSVLLLGRPDCHLCEAFEDALRSAAAAHHLRIEHACVDERGEWRMRYGRRIPVLLDEAGEVLCEGVFDPATLPAGDRP